MNLLSAATVAEREMCAQELDRMHEAVRGGVAEHNYFAWAARQLRAGEKP